MSAGGHTPGPWEFVPTSGEDDRFDIYQAHTAWTVARTVNNAHVDCREANARLIAAAPALLEACEQMLERLKHIIRMRDGLEGDEHRAVENARAAIAQATGRQP